MSTKNYALRCTQSSEALLQASVRYDHPSVLTRQALTSVLSRSYTLSYDLSHTKPSWGLKPSLSPFPKHATVYHNQFVLFVQLPHSDAIFKLICFTALIISRRSLSFRLIKFPCFYCIRALTVKCHWPNYIVSGAV